VSVEPIESLISRIMRQYDRKPEGWTVLTDHKGNVLILGPKAGYRLKLIPLNPQEYTGVGMKIDGLQEMRRLADGTPSYGFRPLSSTQAEELFNTFRQEAQSKLINEILKTKPVPTWQLRKKRPEAVLGGPVITHPDLSAISSSQRELEARLAVEADKIFRKKYPYRASIYG